MASTKPPNPPETAIFTRKKTAAELLREKIPPEKRPTNDMLYEKLQDPFLKNLPGNRKPSGKTVSTETTFSESTIKFSTDNNRPLSSLSNFSTSTISSLQRQKILPPLLHLDKYRHDNDPSNIRDKNKQNLIRQGYTIKGEHFEPSFEAHKTVSTTSTKLSRKFLHDGSSDAERLASSRSSMFTTSSINSQDLLTNKLYRDNVNPQDIVDYMASLPYDDFIYVVFAYPPNHVKFDPFNLRVIPFNKITNFNYDQYDENAIYDHSMDYFTVCKQGVVRLKTHTITSDNVKRQQAAVGERAKHFATLQALVMPGEQSFEFIDLTRWLEEFKNHKKLMKKRSFAKFRIWKAFYTWRTNVRKNKIENVKDVLRNDLYILNGSLRPALLNVRLLCDQISSQTLCKIEPNNTYSLDIFTTRQMRSVSIKMQKLEKFRKQALEKVKTACRSALLEAGFTPDDTYLRRCDSTGQLLPPDETTIDIDPPEKMTYTQQATKRRQCRRLTSFIRLCDYIVVDAMHSLSRNSIEALKTTLTDQNISAPSHEEITSWALYYQDQTGQLEITDDDSMNSGQVVKSQKPAIDLKNNEEGKVVTMQISDESIDEPNFIYDESDLSDKNRPTPLFLIKIIIDQTLADSLQFEPSEDTFLIKINKIIEKFEETCKTVQPLVNDVQFESFTKPLINRKFEQKSCGEGPQLFAILEDDTEIATLKSDIEICISDSFDKCDAFSNHVQFFYNFYKENEDCDPETFNEKDDVAFFKNALNTYAQQSAQIKSIHDTRKIGMLLIDNKLLKNKIGPSPEKMLSCLNEMLPKLARKKLDALMKELTDTKFQLDVTPSDTPQYVDHLTFLDGSVQRQPDLIEEGQTVQKYYKMFKRYEVPIPPEDSAIFETLDSTVNGVRDTVDRCLSERDSNIDKLAGHIERDVTDLNTELKDVKELIQNPLILDAKADQNEVKSKLDDLNSKLSVLLTKAHTFKSYQKQFKLDPSNFETLEAIDAEVQMKKLAWSIKDDWRKLTSNWDTTKFIELDPEDMGSKLQQYTKNVVQLEKGLPPNSLVPVLRSMVETTRGEHDIIKNLRNPCMEGRHWGAVEKLLERKVHIGGVNIEGGYTGTALDTTENEDPKDEELTLKMLRDWGVTDDDKLSESIELVSGQASGEQALKQMLSKVEDGFKESELVVLPHRDSKDVFILGGTDDVQAELDDARVSMATIASSRYVGPIKPKVDEWQRQLNLMADTLDEWLTCQRSWLYLESIFSAPDIVRQLPNESKTFSQVDKSWKEIMRKTDRLRNSLRACTQPGLLEAFKMNNKFLDEVQKCLEQYLETKRVSFPRFYFLSNDELLEILAQTKNPLAVQPHLRKCFDAMTSLTFAKNANGQVTDITHMNSPEGESVPIKNVKPRGNVEDWLCKVEESMIISLRKLTKESLAAFLTKPRHEWVADHAAQVILTVSQTMWCTDVTTALAYDDECDKKGEYVRNQSALAGFEQVNIDQLLALAAIVREKISPLLRCTLSALITIDVHARDIITDLVRQEVKEPSDFEWLRQVRYYWENEIDNSIVRCSDSRYVYGYEYLGASPRLVITPLTDRCYLCLMGALQLDLGGAPAGPAGTGKTETTKDLAKALAKQCIVFNCSDQMDYRMMGKFFSGLAQSGAWACFDEFNRIDIEVLSVIAQQLLTIMNAKAAKLNRFMFEGREIKLEPTCASFITMNPGYAGRTELPDNLKALFRPMSMMVPNYRLIAEVVLFSEGFESSKNLANKMTQMYKLCSEQLSQQDHYDFGMRAVKSVLVMAGSLKRSNPNVLEDIVLIRALRDSNLPKFLKNDAMLFNAVLTDLFPGAVIPEHDYGVFNKAIEKSVDEFKLQHVPSQRTKIIQYYETLLVRHGVMLVGPTGGGKTTVSNILASALGHLRADGHSKENPDFKPVHKITLNPKSIDMGELYGEENPLTLEWQDGLMAKCVREAARAANSGNDAYHWIICDGPVDALWIENMNTVLDDNKTLCLANSERIKLSQATRMCFEVQDLSVASPATVSRCGMVYIDNVELGWKPYVRTWLTSVGTESIPSALGADNEDLKNHILDLFFLLAQDGHNFIAKHCKQLVATTELGRIASLCSMFESCLSDKNLDINKQMITQVWLWCYIWTFGGCLVDTCWESWDTFVRGQVEDISEARLPTQNDLFSYNYNLSSKRWEPWTRMIQTFRYDPEQPFFDMLVSTVDTVRFTEVMTKFMAVNYPVLFTGQTGVGKTVVAKNMLQIADFKNNDGNELLPLFINFSAQSSSHRTQEIIELRMEKRRKNLLAAPLNKQMALMIDDLNMPRPETYGSQPPLELLRQIVDQGGVYDRPEMFWKVYSGITLVAACGPPGGGRTTVPPRLQRRLATFCLPAPSEPVLKTIFSSILTGFLSEFNDDVKNMANGMVEAAIEIYRRMASELLPTPQKSHYVFNLRDLSKCIQGILRVTSTTVKEPKTMFRLFAHESQRVFHDRLINSDDKQFFLEILADVSGRFLKVNTSVEEMLTNPIIYGDFIKPGLDKEDRVYDDLTDKKDRISTVLMDYMDDYNLQYNKNVKLVFFSDAVLHVSRIARILGQERGNALLVGVGGTGKQSLTRLAAFCCDCKCFQIELCRGYDYNSFHDDLRKLYKMAGVDGNETVFLFTDTQIVVEEFLEDINNILNSGEVPNLFEKDELEQVLSGVRPHAKSAGVNESDRDALWQFFISRVRSRLHLVLAMSPVGDSFRARCRQFPSLINCCTIDWFVQWPEEALFSVSQSFFDVKDDPSSPYAMIPEELVEAVSKMCVEIHTSTENKAELFYSQLGRRFYTTPTSYLELLNLFGQLLSERRKKLKTSYDRYASGLQKLADTNTLVETMQVELAELAPILKQKSKDTEILMEKLSVDQEEADKVRQKVEVEEKAAQEKATETQEIADDAQRDLDQALPILEAANKALDSLDKSDISEIRVFKTPPDLVVMVMEAVCILMGTKADWAGAKVMLGDGQFLNKLINYDKDNIPNSILKKLKKYIDKEEFQPEKVEKVSKACKSMCFWARAVNTYAYVAKEVEPKKAKLAKANSELEAVMTALAEKQAILKEVEDKIDKLQAMYKDSVEEKDKLMKNMALTAARLKRAGKLTSALGAEGERWGEQSQLLEEQMNRSTGDALLSAAAVAYLGSFTSEYRNELMNYWATKANELGLPATEGANLETLIGDPFTIRSWNAESLPRDQLSTENAILVTTGRRWPLLIDPQDQANRWIRQRESKNGLKVIKLTDPNFLRTLENAVRTGMPVLLEDVEETLDPALEPILLKQTFISGGRLLIRLGDSDIDYDKNFKFYMTSKMANPHYLPELQIKVTLINFTVTSVGLEDQILSELVKLERPDLEEQRSTLINNINADKTTLDDIEKNILKMLFESTGNILDNEPLINALNESKKTADNVKNRLEEAEKTEIKITTAREKYRPVAAKSSVLYFVVANMALVDPMYQYSLKYYQDIFTQTVINAEKDDDLNVRLAILSKECTSAVYRNVARGLFERHKLSFSFLMSLELEKLAGRVSNTEFMLLLKGVPTNPDRNYDEKPDSISSDDVWKLVTELSDMSKTCEVLPFDKMVEDVELQHVSVTIGKNADIVVELNDKKCISYKLDSDTEYEKTNYDTYLTPFQKILLVRIFRPEKLLNSLMIYVEETLGKEYVLPPPSAITDLYRDITNTIPLIFILSPGSDPMSEFQKFAQEVGFASRYHVISLGQGQGIIAQRMIESGVKSGDWIFLQNCHLAKSWMPSMESIIKGFSDTTVKRQPIHGDFRLWLSSMPTPCFPVSVLQGAVKVTNEPPAGIRANLKRSIETIEPDFLEKHQIGTNWRRSIMGVCFFHAITLERKRFGALGWNIPYEFSNSDRECALRNFELWSKSGTIQWDALLYITGWVTYGGRVTDEWDQRTLNTVMRKFIGPHCLEDGYSFTKDGIYRAPKEASTIVELKEYIASLPHEDSPEVFGMNANAQLAAQNKEMRALIDNLAMVAPKTSGGAGQSAQNQIVIDMSEQIANKVMQNITSEHPCESLFIPDKEGRQNSLSTVLMQEIERFNKLLKVIHVSLFELKRAIAGIVVMSEEIEDIYNAFLMNQVPTKWSNSSYPSPKTLISWVSDLIGRCEFFKSWLENGLPKAFRLSYFFFPQGFMTGNLQNYSRKNTIAIDQLSFKFKVLPYPTWPDVLSPDNAEIEDGLPDLGESVLIYGLYCDAFRWDLENMVMADEFPRITCEQLPIMEMEPMNNYTPNNKDYNCPLYKTPSRAGTLSTTGHSTNFVCPVNLATDKETDFWIKRGTALICQTQD